nr:hypothetical protein [Tanacetum cinerariifolium]
MTTVNQGMSIEEIKRVVAQRVANAIEAIAIYETKTNLARKSISQTERQKEKVEENTSNKRKWEGNHNGSSSQQNKGHKVPRAHTAWLINKKAYAGSLPLCNQCKSHHSGPCTSKQTSKNGDDNHDSGTGSRRTEQDAPDNCTIACQIKFATCTLQGNALTWWNFHVKTVTHEVVYAIPWKTLKNIMTDKYCPRGEIKKLEIKMWNLKVKGTDVYVGGLPDMIYGSVMASKPKTMQDAIKFATELMDKEISTLVERQAEKKRKLNNNNQAQQQPPKK